MTFNRSLSGFNRMPLNRSVFSDVLYTSPEASSTTSEGTVTALFIIAEIEFTGTISVGETVCIDASRFTVKKDGANYIHEFDGDFPELLSGENEITYSDGEVSRTVAVTVSRRDRKI